MGTAAQARYRNMIFDSGRWDGFRFRDDDIVISTPPKCGTTWTQMICALLIFQTTSFDAPLDVLSPWVDMLIRDRDTMVAELDAQTHRRFIKSHTPYDGLPGDRRVTYVCVGRDPRDVALSWDNHMANMDFTAFLTARRNAVGLDDIADLLAQGPPPRPESEQERFWGWVEGTFEIESATSSLEFTLHHLSTFWERRDDDNVVLLRYEDLQADLEGEMRRLAVRLGINVAEESWPALVEAATFDSMRSHADMTAPETRDSLWLNNQQFFHRGTCGQWRTVLAGDDAARYRNRVESLPADPDLVAWVHGGPLG